MTALSVKNLTKTYPNGVTALKGIDLDVAEGDFFALLGQNGAGKSTFIGIVSSLVNKTSGDVSVFGHRMDTERALAKSFIGVVPQEINFGIFENITHTLINQAGYYGIPRRIAYERAEKYLKEMGLWNMRDWPAMRLSGGMKRRLMIARALMSEPRLLILDEPTAGVDIEIRHALWQFLKKLNESGTTIILTTHYLEEAEHLCKNVAIIDRGQIIEHANMKTFIQQIHRQTLICDLDQPLWQTPVLPEFTTRMVDPKTLEIEVTRGQTMNALFTHLNTLGISVMGLRNKTNRLEELFIHRISENHKSTDSA